MKYKRRPLPMKTVFLITFILFILCTFQGLLLIDRGIEPYIMSYAKSKAHQMALLAINDSLPDEFANQLDIDEIVVLHNVEGTDQVSYSFDPKEYTTTLNYVTKRIESYLRLLETGKLNKTETPENEKDVTIQRNETDITKPNGVISWVPLGVATKMPLFSNLGPKIPVRIEVIGDVATEIITKYEKVAINNTYLQLFIDIKVEMDVIIPSLAEPIVVTNKIKIGDLFIPGEVPDVYMEDGASSGAVVPVMPNYKD